MNTSKKGWRKELQARKELEEDGWTVVFKSTRFKFGCNDFGRLFDIVAYKKNGAGDVTRLYISVKHWQKKNKFSAHKNRIRLFAENFGKYDGELFMLWLWKKGGYGYQYGKQVYYPSSWEKCIVV